MHTCSPTGACTCPFDPAAFTSAFLAEVTAQALPTNAAPVTPFEAWLLLRVPPPLWPKWLDLYRADDCDGDACARFAVLIATRSLEERMAALRELEAMEAQRARTSAAVTGT